jgi:hypothetical protein
VEQITVTQTQIISEPSTFLISALGLLELAFVARRRRKRG